MISWSWKNNQNLRGSNRRKQAYPKKNFGGHLRGGKLVRVENATTTHEKSGICQSGGLVKVVGNGTIVNPHEHFWLKGPKGSLMPRKKWSLSRKMFKPYCFTLGDCLSNNATGTTPNAILVSGTTVTPVANMGWNSDTATVSRVSGSATTVMVAGTKSNVYTDICVPLLKNKTYFGTTTLNNSFGLQDCFQKSSSGAVNPFIQIAAGDTNTYNNANNFDLNVNQSAKGYIDDEAFMSLKTEFRLHNVEAVTTLYEVYVVVPKICGYSESPLYSFTNATLNTTTEDPLPQSSNGYCAYSLEYSPVKSKVFNDLWRIVQKKTVALAPMAGASLHISVPWSHVRGNVLNTVSGNDIPWLTHYLYVRAVNNPVNYHIGSVVSSVFTTSDETISCPPVKFMMQMFQKVSILPVIGVQNHYSNFVNLSASLTDLSASTGATVVNSSLFGVGNYGEGKDTEG